MYWKSIGLATEEIVPRNLTDAPEVKCSEDGKIGLKCNHYALE